MSNAAVSVGHDLNDRELEEVRLRQIAAIVESSDDAIIGNTQVQAGDRVEQCETGRARKDGKVIDVWLTISGVKDASGAIVGASTIEKPYLPDDLAQKVRETLDRQADA